MVLARSWLKNYGPILPHFTVLIFVRVNTKNAFEKDLFKLMNKSVFGKKMENLRERVDVRLVTDEKKLIKTNLHKQ